MSAEDLAAMIDFVGRGRLLPAEEGRLLAANNLLEGPGEYLFLFFLNRSQIDHELVIFHASDDCRSLPAEELVQLCRAVQTMADGNE